MIQKTNLAETHLLSGGGKNWHFLQKFSHTSHNVFIYTAYVGPIIIKAAAKKMSE